MAQINIYEKLNIFFDNKLILLAQKFNYSQEKFMILNNDEISLLQCYPEVYKALESCNHNRDKRTLMEYAQTLVCSWIFEDFFLFRLQEKGLKIQLSGSDYNRDILNTKRIKSDSDYMVKIKNKKIHIELINDYNGYWIKNKTCDLRDDKYLKIKNISNPDKNEYSLLLGIDINNKKFFIYNLKYDFNNIKYSQNHIRFGNKPVYSISLKDIKFIDFNFDNILTYINLNAGIFTV